MGRKRENPRYNVLSLRLSDDELEVVQLAAGDGNLSDHARDLIVTGSIDALVAEQFGTGQPGGSVHVPLMRD